MSYVSRIRLSVTATTSGGSTFYSPVVNGYIEAIRYTRGASGFSTACHLAVVADGSSNPIWDGTCTGNFTAYPRAQANNTGTGFYSAATGAGAVLGMPVHIPVGNERVRFTFSSMTGASAGLQAAIDLYISGQGA